MSNCARCIMHSKVPLEKSKCWTCAQLKADNDAYVCPRNRFNPREPLPAHFAEKCPLYTRRDEANEA